MLLPNNKSHGQVVKSSPHCCIFVKSVVWSLCLQKILSYEEECESKDQKPIGSFFNIHMKYHMLGNINQGLAAGCHQFSDDI